ncbi:MAG: guanylate kinase [Clostridia bacterium]|nr:guanylate kinase [Clostridia bacterium]MBR6564140.1 guanylate kinase [Clostridia bacterium]
MNKGKIFVISGPSGSGKDTLMAEIFKKRPDIKFSISSITRPMRAGEVEGQKYNFISREKFEEMLEKDMFLEHNEFVGNYYGTPKQPVLDAADNGFNILIEVDVNGADQIRAKLPQALSIFIMPPSVEVLMQRLSGRGTETEDIIAKRMESALSEMSRSKEYDYTVINDDIQTAVDEIIAIIDKQ